MNAFGPTQWYRIFSAGRAIRARHYVLPPGYVLALNFVGLHYNPKYWGASADKFIPERWAMNSEFNKNDPIEQKFFLSPMLGHGVLKM
jgi:cytochrome P450